METRVFELETNIDHDDLKYVTRKYTSNGLVYGWKANNENPLDHGHWNKTIMAGSMRYPYDMLKTPLNKDLRIKNLWLRILDHLEIDRALSRVYINGYTYGTEGYAHYDDINITKKFGKEIASETIIVYLNEDWDVDWGGETVIFNENKDDIEKAVLPKFARVLSFDSNKLHAARSVSRICQKLRLVLVFKTIDRSIESKEVDFICKHTSYVDHSGRTFFEHLLGTMKRMEAENLSDELCLAGLYHSVYGTEFFQYKNEEITRDTVKGLIGEFAESLVYEFCTLKNRYDIIVNNTKGYNAKTLYGLRHIELANLRDQNVNGTYDDQIEKLKDVLKEEN